MFEIESDFYHRVYYKYYAGNLSLSEYNENLHSLWSLLAKIYYQVIEKQFNIVRFRIQ